MWNRYILWPPNSTSNNLSWGEITGGQGGRHTWDSSLDALAVTFQFTARSYSHFLLHLLPRVLSFPLCFTWQCASHFTSIVWNVLPSLLLTAPILGVRLLWFLWLFWWCFGLYPGLGASRVCWAPSGFRPWPCCRIHKENISWGVEYGHLVKERCLESRARVSHEKETEHTQP